MKIPETECGINAVYVMTQLLLIICEEIILKITL